MPNHFLQNYLKVINKYFQKTDWAKLHNKLTKYLFIFLKHIFATSFEKNLFWASISRAIMNRFLQVTRANPIWIYKNLFPYNYVRHARILEVLYSTFLYKNLTFLKQFILEMFRLVNFFKHRFLLYFFRAVLVKLNKKNMPYNVKGLYFKFRGKLAQAGNSRRKRFIVSCGKISTSYDTLYNVEKFQIYTFTGAIGCTIVLAYF